jgi:hypothetical protein
MAGDAQQDLALGERLVHELELVLLEVAQPAVDQLRRRRRGGAARSARSTSIVDRPRPRRRARSGAVDAAADDEQVVVTRGAL